MMTGGWPRNRCAPITAASSGSSAPKAGETAGSGPGRGGGAGAVFAGSGGARWPGAHVVADPGHDVAEVVQVVVGQGVEQQAGDLGVAGQDAVEEGPAVVRDGDQGGAFVVRGGASGDEAGLLQQAGLVGQAAAAVDDTVGQLRHGQRAVRAGETGQELELHVAEVAFGP